MSRIASLPLFVDDFEAATAHLTLEEDGAYNRLLRLCWRQSDCTIPNDDKWIARRMRCDGNTYARVIIPILSEFFIREKGRIFQKRLSEEHAYVKKAISARKKAGSKGGKASSLKNNENHTSNAQANVEQTLSNAQAPFPFPFPFPTPNVDIDTNVSIDPFDEFWNLFPRQRRGGKENAKKAYLKALDRATEQEILDGVKSYAGSSEVAGGFAKGATAWLNDDRWASEYHPPGGNGYNGGGSGAQGKVGGTIGAAQSILDRWREEDGGGGV